MQRGALLLAILSALTGCGGGDQADSQSPPPSNGPSLSNVTVSTSYPRSVISTQEIAASEYSAVRLKANIRPGDFEVTEAYWHQTSGKAARFDNPPHPDFLPIPTNLAPLFEIDVFLPEVGVSGDLLAFELVAVDAEGKKASATITVTVINIERGSGKLNDTGVTACIGDDYRTTNCDDIPASLVGQDAQTGWDARFRDDTDGRAGFSFTKLDEFGNALPANASEWSCVKDERTGLAWEAKTQEPGLHHYDAWYTWRNLDVSVNGGFSNNLNYDDYNFTSCAGSECFTDSFIEAVNNEELCGRNNWRLPEIYEAISLFDLGAPSLKIDTNYFPQAKWTESPPTNWATDFWSGTPLAEQHTRHLVWVFNMRHGFTTATTIEDGQVGRIILISGND